MEEIIDEETSPRELSIKRGSLGLASALLIAGGIASGIEVLPHVFEAMTTPSLQAENLTALAEKAKETAAIVSGLGAVGVMSLAGLEFGDLAIRSHQRLRDLVKSTA